jgi:hypothetical protein
MAGKRGRPRTKSKAVKEPIQVYLDAADRTVLDGVAERTGLSRAEVLRRGLRSYAAQQQGSEGPMLRLIRELSAQDWGHVPTDMGINHDKYLAEAYLDTHADAL